MAELILEEMIPSHKLAPDYHSMIDYDRPARPAASNRDLNLKGNHDSTMFGVLGFD